MEKIILQHTNDLHSHFENYFKVQRFLEEGKNTKDAFVLNIDLGDFSDRFHPLTEATQGKYNTKLMNENHYDLVTIGNNEGIGFSKENLQELYDEKTFEVVLGNLIDPTTNDIPPWAIDEKVIVTPLGTRIGFLGATAPFPLTYGPNGWFVDSPMNYLQEKVKALREKVDILVLLSHLGIRRDRVIADKFSEIDVILESHTHHLFVEGELQNGVLLAAAGKFFENVGRVEIKLEGKKILQKTAVTFETALLPELPADKEKINQLEQLGRDLLCKKKICNLPYRLSKTKTHQNSQIRACLEAILDFTKTEIAVLNSGLFLHSLPKGEISLDDVHQALPHPMKLIVVTFTGKELKRLVYEMEKNRAFLRHFPIKGMGFRGKIFGEIEYLGISFDRKTKEVKAIGETVDDEREYRIVTVDHYYFIPFFPTIEIAGKVEFIAPLFLREVFQKYLSNAFPITDDTV